MISGSLQFRGLILLVLVCGLFGTAYAVDGIGGGQGYFEITSSPSGADVHFDGSYKGTTPVTVPVYSTGTPDHTISVTKEGYQPWVQQYSGNPFEGETIHINADLVYIPVTQPTTPIGSGKGYYSISSSPQGASVYFDGSYKGTTPVTVTVSTTGTPGHTIMLSLSGYQDWSQNYPGNPGQDQTVYVTAYLSPVQNYGSISVSSSPSGATATLDGSYSQTTPCTFNNVYPGSHSIHVTKDGYEPWSTTAVVSAGRNTQVKAYLNQNPPNTGSLYITSVPSAASVYVDGRYYGPSPQIASNLAVGYHQVRISLSGFQDYAANVYVEGGVTTKVHQVLSVSPTGSPTPVTDTGSVSVSSNPIGAQVFLDGNYVGISPVTIPSVQVGSHVVLLKLGGYADWQATVQVSRNEVTNVDATLSPAPTTGPTRVPLPPVLAFLSLALLALVVAMRRK